MVQITLTHREFIEALNRAAIDDEQRPWLHAFDWLLQHAHVGAEQVTIDTGVQLAPGKAMDH